jgi:ribosomal-protein-alanine N-acetyltransferase
MPVEIHISRAGPYDAFSMAAIHRTCFAKPWDESAMAQFLGSPDALCLVGSVADSSGGIIGGMLVARRAADEAELLTLAVAPACRNAGLGKALLLSAMSLLRQAGAAQLFLEVEEGNEAAVALYRSLGAKPVGRRPRYYETGADAAILSLALSPTAADDVPSKREA